MQVKNKLCPLKLQKGIYFGDCAVTDIANHIRWIANIGVKIEDR